MYHFGTIVLHLVFFGFNCTNLVHTIKVHNQILTLFRGVLMTRILSLYKIKTKQCLLKINADTERCVLEVHSRITNKILNVYEIPYYLSSDIAKIESFSALVRYAKANQIQPTADPVCPRPPETFINSSIPANDNGNKVDGGNLSYLDQLSSVITTVQSLANHSAVTTRDERSDLLSVADFLETIKNSEYDPAYLAGVSDPSMNCGYCGSSFYRSDYGMCSDCFHNAVSDSTSSARCACGRTLSDNDLSLMMCPVCAQFKYNDDYDVPVNGMALPSNLE